MTLTYPDRRAGRDAMDNSLAPLKRAMRRFHAGNPIARLNDAPLSVVLLATEQRERLRRILNDTDGLDSPRITSAAIVTRQILHGSAATIEDQLIPLKEGVESGAVWELERLRDYGHTVAISGIAFTVQAGVEHRHFLYRIERSPEGDAALSLAAEKLLPTAKGKNDAKAI